jgi:hypothetical protein
VGREFEQRVPASHPTGLFESRFAGHLVTGKEISLAISGNRLPSEKYVRILRDDELFLLL